MRIQDVIMHLLLKQPFYGYIASSVTLSESSETPTLSMLTSPSLRLLYNPDWFEGLKEEHAIGVVIHELLHVILLHSFRKGDREHALWVIACDMAVNEHIDRMLLLEDAVTVRKIAEEMKTSIPPNKSAEFYYDFLSDSEEKVSFAENEDVVKVVLQSGQELKANNSTEGDAAEINKSAMKQLLTELMEQAVSEGEIPSSVQGFIDDLYKTHAVNWRNVLKRFLTGKGKTQIRKTCKKESKRFENLPGNKRTVGTRALLALDESGSISDTQIVQFYHELLAIRKITGASVSVTLFDTECTPPVPIEKYTREKNRVKNGGTDFRPVFQLADELRMPLVIVFTDGEGPAPEQANQKVLWVLTKGGKNPAQFGHSIVLED